MKSAKLLFLLLLNFSVFNNQAWADNASQFNFDEDYQGEDVSKKSNQLIYDPFESVNRKVFVFNEFLDKTIALPVTRQYHKSVPQPIRTSVGNFVNNLSTPFSVVNSLLQGNPENAMASFSAFLINSTVGVVGLFDVAGNKKIKFNQEDLGQTFGKYGVGSGPYLVVPFLGPNDLRDFSGFATETALNPISFNVLNIGSSGQLINDETAAYLAASNAIVARENLIEVVDDIRKNSFDPYSTMRSAYMQRRQALILNK